MTSGSDFLNDMLNGKPSQQEQEAIINLDAYMGFIGMFATIAYASTKKGESDADVEGELSGLGRLLVTRLNKEHPNDPEMVQAAIDKYLTIYKEQIIAFKNL
ncbi:hypothetical protein H6F86_20750 [Phormidium sp. FACHB-592]|uniref:Uncharacterized protein n=1 Tax=Stenomitos frigidus AS-A4 TaxID=2933935 RepID=A0ABV0KEK1_9CYAN|nr:hypothetical protein [Phormidium sp. FACHB-592]MBD2076263.1 hypothetical protein [Phormidium sp. FACHB-592]